MTKPNCNPTIQLRSDHPLCFDKSESFTMSLAEGLVARMIRQQKPIQSISNSLALLRYRTREQAYRSISERLSKAGLIVSSVDDLRGKAIMNIALASIAWDQKWNGFIPFYVEVDDECLAISVLPYPYIISAHAISRLIYRLKVNGHDSASVITEILNLAASYTPSILSGDYEDNTLVRTMLGVGIVVKDKERDLPVVTTWVNRAKLRPEQVAGSSSSIPDYEILVGLAGIEDKTLQDLLFHKQADVDALYDHYLSMGAARTQKGALTKAEFLDAPMTYLGVAEDKFGRPFKLNSKLITSI